MGYAVTKSLLALYSPTAIVTCNLSAAAGAAGARGGASSRSRGAGSGAAAGAAADPIASAAAGTSHTTAGLNQAVASEPAESVQLGRSSFDDTRGITLLLELGVKDTIRDLDSPTVIKAYCACCCCFVPRPTRALIRWALRAAS